MKRVLLDTGPLTAYVQGRQGALDQLGPWLLANEAATSALVYGEVHEHFLGQPDYPTNRRALREFLRDVRPLPTTYRVLERYGELRRKMRRPQGDGTIGDVDTLIAATALVHDLLVVTTDRDFMRVPDSRVIVLLPSSLKSSRFITIPRSET